jgi:putative transposase
MRDSRTHQPLTYDVRLPDEAQADALRLLDHSRVVINQALALLWPYLDEFGGDRVGPAWKQVGTYIASPFPHGDRQWRCESEVAGRVLRAQTERKKAFALVAPILSDGFIRPKTDTRPAGMKNCNLCRSSKLAYSPTQATTEAKKARHIVWLWIWMRE